MKRGSESRPGWLSVFAGLSGALLSALVTTGMLLINGSLTLVTLRMFAESGSEWFQREGVLQFILFVVPVMLSVLQWIALDVLFGILTQSRSESDAGSWNST